MDGANENVVGKGRLERGYKNVRPAGAEGAFHRDCGVSQTQNSASSHGVLVADICLYLAQCSFDYLDSCMLTGLLCLFVRKVR